MSLCGSGVLRAGCTYSTFIPRSPNLVSPSTIPSSAWRPAHTRFGPSIASWQKVEGMRESILRGVQSSMGFYIGTIGFMLVLALLGRAQQGAYVSWTTTVLNSQ